MLEIKHLTKAYERVILKDVCLSFKEKGLYVITGQSGCGKSTLLNMIGGLDSNYQGIIEMDGRDIQTIPRYIQKYVGFIFQQFHLIEEMSVKENETLISYFKRIFSGEAAGKKENPAITMKEAFFAYNTQRKLLY